MLTLKNVSAGYGGGDVLHDVSFTIAAGDRLAVMGANGCGKSTMLRAIAGVLPHRGEVLLQSRSTTRMKRREIARHIAMLAQISGIYFSYSVFDTVMMGRYLHMQDRVFGAPTEEDRARVEACLEAVDLLDMQDREITQLSGGQLQRVFLARTFAQEPSIILLDEPTNHLDLRYQIELTDYLETWVQEGQRAVVAALHDVNLALHFCNKALALQAGRTRALGEIDEITSGPLLEEVYGTDVVGYMQASLRLWEGVV